MLRVRRGLRQTDVAIAAGISQSVVSDLERGRISGMALGTIRRAFAAVDAGFEGDVLWRGPALDRLLDADHARLVSLAAERLSRAGWKAIVEATYSVYGERGSIDVLGGLEARRAVVVEEVKTSVVSVEATARKLDEKTRLVREGLAADRFGWRPAAVARLLVLPDTSAARSQVAKNDDVLRLILPARGADVRSWLRAPAGDLGGIVFKTLPEGIQPRAARQRVRCQRDPRR